MSHGAWLGSMLNFLIGPPNSFPVIPDVKSLSGCHNTSVSKIRFWPDGDKWKGEVLTWSETPHLEGMLEKELVVADKVEE